MGSISTRRVLRKEDAADCVINEADFDPRLHEEWKEPAGAEAADPEKPKSKSKPKE